MTATRVSQQRDSTHGGSAQAPGISYFPGLIARWQTRWQNRWQRRILSQLEPRLACDIGIDPILDDGPSGYRIDPRPLWGIGLTPQPIDAAHSWTAPNIAVPGSDGRWGMDGTQKWSASAPEGRNPMDGDKMGERTDAGPFSLGSGPRFMEYARNLHRATVPAIAALTSKLREERSRRALATVDRDTLADLGISVAQAQFESSRPFWCSNNLPERRGGANAMLEPPPRDRSRTATPLSVSAKPRTPSFYF
jgi:uncharacterized protein YjiS (DUF1127 family)